MNIAMRLVLPCLALVGLAITGGVSAAAGPSISVISLSTSGEPANIYIRDASSTPDGRYVVFTTQADNLVTPDTGNRPDVFLRDTVAGTTIRISNTDTGSPPNGASQSPVISEDGRYIAFVSNATDLISEDTVKFNAYRFDRQTGEYMLVSVNTAGDPANAGGGGDLDMSPDGRYLAFTTQATNFSPIDKNDSSDIYIRDVQKGVTRLVSVGTNGLAAGKSRHPELTSDGQGIVFESGSPRLVENDTNRVPDAFVRDRSSHTTERVSLNGDGEQANGETLFGCVSISGSGRFVAFISLADNLAGVDENDEPDVFLHDRETGATKLISKTPQGSAGDGGTGVMTMSLDGRFIAFDAYSVLTSDDTNGPLRDVYLWDRPNQQMSLISKPLTGTQEDTLSDVRGISADGRFVYFGSNATNLVEDDPSVNSDLFVLDRTG